ncbi:MAG TPA: NAD(P)-dependent alcohol dehydrogenase [Gemmatimonadaceae bacterium]
MRAATIDRYGPAEVVSIATLPAPPPGEGQVLVRVRAASLNPLDSALRSGALRRVMPLRFPAVLGFDLAGEVEATGPGVTSFRVGERVYGRIDARTGGTHAELAVVAANVLDRIPDRLTFEQAAALPLTAMTAVQAFGLIGLDAGDRLLVNGAAGGVGVYAVQIGRAMGASVTGVCSGASASLVQRLGAVRVIDYTRGELATERQQFDVVFDVVAKLSTRDARRLLAKRGRYVTTGISPAVAVRSILGRFLPGRRWTFVMSRADGELMRQVSRLVSDGALDPVIDSTFPLERIQDAYARLETGHAHGKVVVQVP